MRVGEDLTPRGEGQPVAGALWAGWGTPGPGAVPRTPAPILLGPPLGHHPSSGRVSHRDGPTDRQTDFSQLGQELLRGQGRAKELRAAL